jgi:hypothetical protein
MIVIVGHHRSVARFFFASLLAITRMQAGTLESVSANAAATAKSTPPWAVTVQGPGWLAGLTGNVGSHGVTTHVNIGFGDYINKINALAGFSLEVRRGRIGATEGLIYLGAQTSRNGSGVVNKTDLHAQQYLNQFYLSYRVLETPHAWLDLITGLRFIYIGSQASFQSNQANVNMTSTQLVNRFAEQATTPGTDINALVRQVVDSQLKALAGSHPPLPVPPLAGREPGEIREALRQLLANARPELIAAIQSNVQARVDQAKAQLTNQVANTLNNKINRSFSLYESWFDPFFGVRGRYNFYKSFYLTGYGDVGGFGIGSEVTTQIYAALGAQITNNLRAEVGYRWLYMDYDTTALIYQVSMHGPQISMSISF